MDTEGLSVICTGLWYSEEYEDGTITYNKKEIILDNLKDLLRFLRRDDPDTRDVFKQVCKWNIVGKYLIPILEHCQDDRNLVLNTVKVLVFLTMPLEVSSKDVNQQLEYLWSIKSAVTSSDVVAVIVSLLEKPLEHLESMEFSEDDWKLVQLVLTLFRNILAIQDISIHQKALGTPNHLLSLRDDFLERLFKENVMDLIIIITQHVGGSCRYLRHDNLLLLEIYHYIFIGQDPEFIAKVCMGDSKTDEDVKAGLDSLESIMQEESAKRRQARLHASRHSQFGATFTRLTLDGSKSMCKGTPTPASCDKLLKPEKVHRGPSKRVVKDYARAPTTKRSLLEMLQGFINQFLTGGYNVLMQSIVADIEKEHHAIQTSDVLMFFHLAQFVTSFQYHKSVLIKHNVEANPESSLGDNYDDDDSTWFKGDICGPIAATMNESMFGLVVAKWQLAFGGLKETKNNAFLSVSGSLMKTMIRMLDLVLKLMPESSKEPQTARIILYKLFYDQTEQGLTQFLLTMARSFDAHKQPKSDFADLVEILHVVIRLMEKLQAHGTLRVAKKARKTKRKKSGDLKNTETGIVGDDVTTLNEIQPTINKEHLDGEIPEKENSTQSDCDGKVKNADQKNTESKTVGDDATIQNENQSNEEHPDRDIPEQDNSTQAACDGKEKDVSGSAPNDETETFMTEDQNRGSGLPENDQEEANQIHENSCVNGAYVCSSSEDEQAAATAEVDFKMTSWLIHLATANIISNLCWLLKFYKSNSTATNYYVISLLRRICDDLDLAPMLYQLSCLVIFYEILDEQKARPQKEYDNVVHFLTSLVRRMLRKLKNHPLLFVDLLFWKSRKDCHYINVESIHREVGEMRKEVRNWGSEDAGPSQASEGVRKSLADALGDDEYDVMVSGEPRHEIDVDLNEAAENLLQTGDNGNHARKFRKENHTEGTFEGTKRKKRRLILSSKLEEQIRSLYEKYKDSPDCSQLIAEALDADGSVSPAQVSRKCKKLGLKLPPRKGVNVEAMTETETSHPDPDNPDGPFLKKPSHRRRRIRATDENLLLKIISLYEQFKDHNRCSHMIAKELDPNGAVTAAQVSRNLKKLGLHTSRMRGDAKKPKMDETDNSTDDEDDSDNLTLSLLKKRSKNSEGVSFSTKEAGKSNAIQSPGLSSDDELVLSNILKKSKRGRSEPEDRLVKTLTKQDSRGQESEEQISQRFVERDDGEQAKVMDIDVETQHSEQQAMSDQDLSLTPHYNESNHSGDQASDLSPDSISEIATNDSLSRKRKGLSLNESADSMQNENHYNELEDSEDETQPSASPKSVTRRNLRVVLDFDDDDE
ncbi:hypothetical protein RND81_14G108100 [Saponaria officinalis]|uniref:Timeless N-terminal domain-containing protein n=1 Tax=Saponaria officinalis TaxID=3572 RepID=A0AAW1GKZ3_SAPOF